MGQRSNYSGRRFLENYGIIEFDVLNEKRDFEVMAMFHSRQYGDDEAGLKYCNYIDLSQWSIFNSFVSQAKAASRIDTDVTDRTADTLHMQLSRG